VTVNLEPTTFGTTSVQDFTGNSARVLAGSVNDPDIGTTEATGYLDISPPSTLPADFFNSTVQKAELVLIPDYVYGDTLQTQQLAIYDMPSEWDASGRTVDETLSAGARITQSTSFAPGDTVTIDLPSSWGPFQRLSDTTDFNADVHGFQLQSTSGNAVAGYLRSESFLRVITDQDTAAYPGSKSFTSIDHPNTPTLSDRVLLQDGRGHGLSFRFTLPDSLQNAPISRAELYLPTDTSLFDPASLPNGFVRPQTNNFGLQGFSEDSTLIFAAGDSLNADGVFTFSASQNASLRQIFQNATLGRATVDQYLLTLSQANNTINPLLFYGPGIDEKAPRVLLTIAQSDN